MVAQHLTLRKLAQKPQTSRIRPAARLPADYLLASRVEGVPEPALIGLIAYKRPHLIYLQVCNAGRHYWLLNLRGSLADRFKHRVYAYVKHPTDVTDA